MFWLVSLRQLSHYTTLVTMYNPLASYLLCSLYLLSSCILVLDPTTAGPQAVEQKSVWLVRLLASTVCRSMAAGFELDSMSWHSYGFPYKLLPTIYRLFNDGL